LIVKADDFGLLLAKKGHTGAGRAFGRSLVVGMPVFMQGLAVIGTAAMIWVGGGIVIHGLVSFGFAWPEHVLEAAAEAVAHALPSVADFAGWVITALLSGIGGIVLGAVLIPVAQYVIAPLWAGIRGMLPKRA
jgi:predicted DNA repair protein MutK